LFCTGVCGCSVDENISCKNKCDKWTEQRGMIRI
jgi:hypothetical protein